MRLATAMLIALAATTVAPAQVTQAKNRAGGKPMSPPATVSVAAPALAG